VVADEPWKTPNAAALDDMNTATWLRDLPVSKLCKLALASQLAGNNGVALGRQSYLGNLSQVKGGGLEKYWTDSEIYRCRGGNQRLAEKLAHTVGEHLRLETPVTRVETKQTSVVVHCANGETLEADDVVLTIPPSMWRQISFDPGLPGALHPQMGTVMKYLSEVKGPFWTKQHLSPDATTDELISMTWDGTDGQGKGRSVLTAFSGGPSAVRARRQWAQSGDRPFKELLEKLYPGYGDNFIASRFMDWASDPWTRAGYSFPAPGQIMSMGPGLRAGVGPLHFAGEHTCYKFVGYMEGALDSGVAAARGVLRVEAKAATA
jgi:monoamine oxidase